MCIGVRNQWGRDNIPLSVCTAAPHVGRPPAIDQKGIGIASVGIVGFNTSGDSGLYPPQHIQYVYGPICVGFRHCGMHTNISVIPHMFCSGDGVVYSDSSTVPLADYLGEALLKDKVVKHKRSEDNDLADNQDLSDRFPFLRRYMAEYPLEPKSPDHNDSIPMETDGPASDPLDDDEMDAVFAALQQRRQAWAVDYDQPAHHFKTCILGGAWSQVHRGAALADVRAFASGPEPVAWCKKYFGVQQSSYSYRKYGDAVASSLALFWTHRMEHFYRIFLAAEDANYHYTAEDKDTAPNPDMVLVALNHAGDKAVSGKKRLNELVALMPGSPGSSSSSR